MDDNDMPRNQNYFSQYGCSMVLVGDPNLIPQLHSYGYSLDSIFIQLGPTGWQDIVDATVNEYGVKRFYIDEPIRNGYQQFVRDASTFIALWGGALTISESYFDWYDWYINGGRGRIGAMVDLALSCSPPPFVCCHTHFEDWDLLDPRDQWTYIHDRVPQLFKMVIIKSGQTADEMTLLWGHANNLGLNQVLLYPFWNGYYAGVQTALTQGNSEGGWAQRYFLELREVWCCPSIYWEEDVCTYQYSDYTGGAQWF
ncbi:MAG: hypothetical protein KGJ59_09900 [Bacteroidota bacterium]|nr:hypothetical protein [Bacteroidota bacterium]